jgi:hypothetical protein
MSQAIKDKKTTDQVVAQNTRRGWQLLGAFVAIQLVLILLKAHGLSRVAAWSWIRVTALSWGPWVFAVVVSFIVLIARLGEKLRTPKAS